MERNLRKNAAFTAEKQRKAKTNRVGAGGADPSTRHRRFSGRIALQRDSVDFPALGVENVGEFGGSMERA
jgi:hypothetical protein